MSFCLLLAVFRIRIIGVSDEIIRYSCIQELSIDEYSATGRRNRKKLLAYQILILSSGARYMPSPSFTP